MKSILFKLYSVPNMIRINLSSISSFVILSALIISQIACVDLEFDTPPAGGFDPNLAVNTTIAELKSRHSLGQYEEITDDVILSGIVISNDAAGNFFKQLVIQDSTGGIEIRIEMTDMHNIYPVGRKVYVKAKGLWLGDYNGLIQLGAGYDPIKDELIRIPESIVNQFIVIATFGHVVVPETKTIDQLTLADVSTLIKLENVQFVAADAGETWADAVLQLTLNREIEDCAKRRVIVRTSGFATFAGDLTPEGNGTFIGVLGVFGSDYQFTIRDLNDVMMTGGRCTSNATTIASIRNLFTGGPTILTTGTIRGVVTSDYNSQSVTGRNLYIQDATGGIVIRFTANHSFNLGDEISIDISGATLNEFMGLLQVEGVTTSAASVEGSPGDVTPREATIIEVLNNAEAWESTLVKINDVRLSGSSTYSGEIVVTDATGSMILFTRPEATFSSQPLDTGLLDITVLVSQFNVPQLIMRKLSDISGGNIGGGQIDESFNNIGNDQDVILPGWTNIAVKGTRLWRGKIFGGNHYAQATAFGDLSPEMESWLITPAIELDVPKKLTFESAMAFYEHDGLTVWISTDFNGTNVTTANWQPLSATLAGQSTPDNEFIPSGDIDLSGFTGTVYIGFKYVGSGPGGQTTSYRLDNIKVENL